ncbi:MAG: hypothetical protein IT229_13315 [Flavobacteriales bacterium]|nr:hypothetical protein [Flavobacteriales bacterium]
MRISAPWSVVLLAWLISHAVSAQFDVGAAVGVFDHRIDGKSGKDDHQAMHEAYGAPFPTASLYYREQREGPTNLAFELAYSRKEFSAVFQEQDLGRTNGKDLDVRLDMLHVGVIPEVKLGTMSKAVVRFGLQVGFLLNSRMRGWEWSSGPDVPGGYQRNWTEGSAKGDFGGDVRALFGFGFQIPVNERSIVTVDPYLSGSVTSMLKDAPGSRSTEWGLRIGYAISFNGNGLSHHFSRFVQYAGSERQEKHEKDTP